MGTRKIVMRNLYKWSFCGAGVLLFCYSSFALALSARIMAERVEIRAGPGVEYPLIQELDLLGTFLVLERTGEWVRLRFIGYTGWIHDHWVNTWVVEEKQKWHPDQPWFFDWHLWLNIPFPFDNDRGRHWRKEE